MGVSGMKLIVAYCELARVILTKLNGWYNWVGEPIWK